MLKVSVVVPVYNPGPYLEPCVTSLTSQTLPTGEYEAIFVDDGSTDGTPAYLDEVAAAHDHVSVIHQENSGWPGKPRNVGISAARGEYVFFCDNDDWLGEQALERMYDFAVQCGSDVVVPKMAGLGRPVPHHVFLTTVPACSLADAPLIDSLTPHKLFRRAFLEEHQIRFPEGRRRLEDHLFVVTAYLLAQTISIYADYTCYFHIRREDSSNGAFTPINWDSYFDNLAEALDVVVAHTDPGSLRHRLFRRWLQTEMVNRLSGERRLRLSEEEAASLFAAAHRIAARYFSEDVVARLPPIARPVGRAILSGDAEAARTVAEHTARWRIEPWLLQAGWSNGHLQVTGLVQLTDRPRVAPQPYPRPATGPAGVSEAATDAVRDGSPAPLPEQRFAELVDDQDRGAFGSGWPRPALTLDLTERRTGERWPVPVAAHPTGLAAAFTADIDPNVLAAGHRLPDGVWDLHVQFGVLGLSQRRRMTLTEERRPGAVLPDPAEDPPTVAAYYAQKNFWPALDVGLVKHSRLRRPPAPEPAAPAAPPPLNRRVLRLLLGTGRR